MKIIKQLFENVLSGKLKGTFVLRNGDKINSKNLERNNSFYSDTHPYRLFSAIYNSNGKVSLYDYEMLDDIIDFIQETDMKENELTIEIPNRGTAYWGDSKLTIKIPDGKLVDWEESKKQNKIVWKDKQLTYEDVCNKLQDAINITLFIEPSKRGHMFVADVQQFECIIAKNTLANVAKYLNNGWKPNKGDHVFTIMYYGDFKDKLIISEHYFGTGESLILFKTQKDAKQAIEILGEETIKLALEPLGI